MSKYYVGDTYSIKPSSVRFDESWIGYNRRYNTTEYEAVKASIEKIGQSEPILINSETGLCEDGYTRTQICTELGLEVKCQQVDGTLDTAIRRELYMRNETGRDYSLPQKAILAYQYMMLTKCKQFEAAKKHKITVRELTSVVSIAGLKRQDVLDSIMKHGEWEGSKSLRAIVNKLKKEEEVVEIEQSETAKIEYEDMINTETGKSAYWKILNMVQLSPHELRMLAVEYVNLKYKLVVNPETGEVTEPATACERSEANG